jgi:hypothetical protein
MWTQPSGKGCNFVKLLSFFQGKTFGGVRKSKKMLRSAIKPIMRTVCLSCPPMYCTASNSRSIPFAFHLLFLITKNDN